MRDAATQIVKDKLMSGTLEHSQGPYRSRYFLVQKKEPGQFRLINDVQPLNKVTIRDAGMPPAVDEFSEEFAGYPNCDISRLLCRIPSDSAGRSLPRSHCISDRLGAAENDTIADGLD